MATKQTRPTRAQFEAEFKLREEAQAQIKDDSAERQRIGSRRAAKRAERQDAYDRTFWSDRDWPGRQPDPLWLRTLSVREVGREIERGSPGLAEFLRRAARSR